MHGVIYEKLHGVSRQNYSANTMIIARQRRFADYRMIYSRKNRYRGELRRVVVFQKKEIVSHAMMARIRALQVI